MCPQFVPQRKSCAPRRSRPRGATFRVAMVPSRGCKQAALFLCMAAHVHARGDAKAFACRSGKCTPCNSTQWGDARFEACGSFCKSVKAANHCLLCKCRACSFCKPGGAGGVPGGGSGLTGLLDSLTVEPTPMGAAPELHALAVTSIYLPQLRVCQLRDGCTLSLFARPLQLPLRAYYDGEGQPPAKTPGVTWVSLDSAVPWAGQFVAGNRGRDTPTQLAYRRKQLKCVVRDSFNRTGVCLDVMTILKTASIFDALLGDPRASTEPRPLAKYIVWLDFDTFFQRPLDARFWAWMGRYDVATIGAKPPHNPETGIIVLDATSPRTLRLVRLARATYTEPRLRQAAGGLNDVQVFGLLFSELAASGLRVGLFAVGCRDFRSRDAWLVDSLLYEAYQYQLCPSDSAAVSPFNVFEYLTHVKRKAGPIATSTGLHGRFRRLPSAASAGAIDVRPATALARQAGRQHGSTDALEAPPPTARPPVAAGATTTARRRKTTATIASVCSEVGAPSWCRGMRA